MYTINWKLLINLTTTFYRVLVECCDISIKGTCETLFYSYKYFDKMYEQFCVLNHICTIAIIDYWDIGDTTYEWEHCATLFWYEERINKHYKSKKSIFTMCCQKGKIKLPELKKPFQVL